MNEQAIGKQGPVRVEVVEGAPIRVGERALVPQVAVTSGGRRRAFVGREGISGRGWGFVRMRPVALLERSEGPALSEVEGSGRRIPIRDTTAQALGGLLLAALVIPLLLALAVRLARRPENGDRRKVQEVW